MVQNKKTPVYELGLKIFRDTIARHSEVKDRLRAHLLANVLKERNGEIIDRMLMKDILAMLVDLGVNSCSVYEEDFEAPLLESTATFYRAESQNYILQNTCPDYLKKVDRVPLLSRQPILAEACVVCKAETRLLEEHSRVANYLNSSSDVKLKTIVETELIQKHATALIEVRA